MRCELLSPAPILDVWPRILGGRILVDRLHELGARPALLVAPKVEGDLLPCAKNFSGRKQDRARVAEYIG